MTDFLAKLKVLVQFSENFFSFFLYLKSEVFFLFLREKSLPMFPNINFIFLSQTLKRNTDRKYNEFDNGTKTIVYRYKSLPLFTHQLKYIEEAKKKVSFGTCSLFFNTVTCNIISFLFFIAIMIF